MGDTLAAKSIGYTLAAKKYGGTTFVIVGRTHDPSILENVIKPRRKIH
jgi:hypothetical protein